MLYEDDDSRLTTTDEKGRRVYVYPEDIKGIWKNRRKAFYWFLILFYLVLPWVYINGKQVILLNLPKREFYLFGYTFYGHDGPMLIFLLLGFIFFVSFVTSVWGRIWCGWACPQTVFIDSIYRVIERVVEGGARRREKLDRAPWSREKVFKRLLKWTLFLLVSLHISHSFIGYFVGTHKLFYITMGSPLEHPTLFITMLFIAGVCLFDFAWFREQFCIVACPYGRIQSVFMDENSMVVAYDEQRGEPRKKKEISAKEQGDCVSCNMCVRACPTGIDIRRGLQLECIACTMCVDACDDIMTRLKKPKGLIKYTSENELKGEKKRIGIRSLVYLFLFIVVMGAFISTLSSRDNLRIQLLRGSKTPYQLVKKASQTTEVINHFKIKIRFYGNEGRVLCIRLKDQNSASAINVVIPGDKIELEKDNTEVNVFFRFSSKVLNSGKKSITLEFLDDELNTVLLEKEVKLVGPYK